MGRVNLINLFDFYLAAFFLLSTFRRWRQYQAIVSILRRAPGRWPRLLQLLGEQRQILLNRAALAPVVMAFILMMIQVLLSRVLLPEATVTLIQLREHWAHGVFLGTVSIPMLIVDGYFLARVGQVDEEETTKYLDRAESWLVGWKTTLVRVVTLGRINPSRIVEEEVRKALAELRKLMARNFYWMALQYGLRVLFGLTLWVTWAWIH